MGRQEFDEYSANYKTILRQSLGCLGHDLEYYARIKVAVVRKNVVAPVNTILEYGCGVGGLVAEMRRVFSDTLVAGCDVSEDSLEIARNRNPGIPFFTPDEDSPVPDGFDVVVVPNVLHHVPPAERRRFLSKVHELLRTGGSVFIFEHNPLNPLVRRIVGRCPLDRNAILLPMGESVRLVLGQFRLASQGYTTFFPPMMSACSSLERWLGWLPLGGQYYVQGRKEGAPAVRSLSRERRT